MRNHIQHLSVIGRFLALSAAITICHELSTDQATGAPSITIPQENQPLRLCHDGHIEIFTQAPETEQKHQGPKSRVRTTNATKKIARSGALTVLFMRIIFPDDATESITEADAQELMLNVNDFIVANSYGLARLSTAVTPLLMLPNPKSWYLTYDPNFYTLLNDARTAAVSAGFDDDTFDLDCVYHPILGGDKAWVGFKGAWLHDANVITACHEFGHNLGLEHALLWEAADGSITGAGSYQVYGNPFDVMGRGLFTTCHFNAYYKNRLNWLPNESVQTVSSDGVYRLYTFDVPQLENGLAYALKISKDNRRDYWIETRQGSNGCNGSLVINWSLAGSTIQTELLDMTPGTGGGSFDTPLSLGRSFYDSDLGLEIVPLRLTGTTPESVDVSVRHVHYLALEAEAGTLDPSLSVVRDSLAANGQAITAAGKKAGTVTFHADIPAAGSYGIWLRARSTQALPISLSIDGKSKDAGLLSEGAQSSDWQWIRITAQASEANSKDFSLSSGNHTIQFGGINQNVQIDSVVITDDPTANIPPLLSGISNQTTTVGEEILVPFTITAIGTAPSTVKLTASSSNPSLVANSNMVLGGNTNSINRTLTLTPTRNQLGTSSITIRAVKHDGTATSTTFSLTVMGAVQAMVNAAAPGDTVVIPAGTYTDRIVIAKDLLLQGAGAMETVVEGNHVGILLTVTNNATVSIRGLTLRNGAGGIRNYGALELVDCAVRDNLNAGGILNASGALLLLENCTVSSNRSYSGRGGGIYNEGYLMLTNTTLSGNRVTLKDEESGGGGIYNLNRVTADHCTITQNRASGGGGIFNAGTAEIGNCIIAGNLSDEESGPDFFGELSSVGYNLIQNTDGCVISGHLIGNLLGLDPHLEPLRDNGGATFTHALQADSPAIDAGNASDLAFDQRGFVRSFDIPEVPNAVDGSDIGAFEYVPAINREIRALVGPGEDPNSIEVRIILIAQGDENAAEFRLSYPEAGLRNPRATPGLDAPEAALTVKSDSAGELHAVLALPAGQVLHGGTRELMVIQFETTAAAAGLELNQIKLDNSPQASTIRNAAGVALSASTSPQTSWNNFRLAAHPEPNGDITLILSGGAGFNWTIQATSDFSLWETVTVLTKVSETAQFVDTAAKNFDQRFYRAIAE